jgi:hypothetical protein
MLTILSSPLSPSSASTFEKTTFTPRHCAARDVDLSLGAARTRAVALARTANDPSGKGCWRYFAALLRPGTGLRQ